VLTVHRQKRERHGEEWTHLVGARDCERQRALGVIRKGFHLDGKTDQNDHPLPGRERGGGGHLLRGDARNAGKKQLMGQRSERGEKPQKHQKAVKAKVLGGGIQKWRFSCMAQGLGGAGRGGEAMGAGQPNKKGKGR